MKFFHVYNEQYFEGLIKNGFINKNTGFKLQHCFAVPDEMKFNRVAAKGGRLHSLLKEGVYPFFVDRLAGGIGWYDYKLLEANINALERQFLPCVVSGLHWLFSRGDDGTRYLTIFNNEGNDRNMGLGNIIDRRADR